ncbi:hypothetical protein QUB80_15625 [Chlorogloeopsis sp. ULAP01]|uniref:hypothetical protein n=1 Tax=Chlorogloeopsis sp. ULAP01 TaxID=3056483 RepID=UPI0025AA4872|nr:hypothetical protein [Chlorogloeopsis sp. ULAP01]MDM9382132.1 hypothetical protein [Chlorogloeopsis sp. ULAP01]
MISFINKAEGRREDWDKEKGRQGARTSSDFTVSPCPLLSAGHKHFTFNYVHLPNIFEQFGTISQVQGLVKKAIAP